MPTLTSTKIGRVLAFVFLEVLAVLLALYQGLSGVQTDEAKYLLNIPYPHPPLVRSLFELLEVVPQQELIIRILMASLLVQAVWLVGALAHRLSVEKRVTLCGLWLFSASVLFQAGTVMMAPLTALQGLLFLWFFFHEDAARRYGGWVALLWLASLFTAYQAILYAPIVLYIFWRNPSLNIAHKTAAVCIPILLVLLYILSNPLAIASFTNAGGQNVALPLAVIGDQILVTWLFAGSAVFSVVGTVALVRSKNPALIASLLLVIAFLAVSYRPYYAVLFLPLFVGGIIARDTTLRRSSVLLALQIMSAVYIFSGAQLSFYENTARTVMRTVNQVQQQEGVVLVSGGFGHQWQYESTSPVYRYRTALLSKAKAVVCLEVCPDVSNYGFYQVGNLAQEVWVRK